MLGEVNRRIPAPVVYRVPCRRVDDGAGRIAVAVASIRSSGEQRAAVTTFAFRAERIRGGQSELLASSAALWRAQAEANSRLAAPQHAAEAGRSRRVRVRQAGFPKAHELVDESLCRERRVVEQGFVHDLDRRSAETERRRGGGVERVAVAEDDRALDRLKRRIARRRWLTRG